MRKNRHIFRVSLFKQSSETVTHLLRKHSTTSWIKMNKVILLLLGVGHFDLKLWKYLNLSHPILLQISMAIAATLAEESNPEGYDLLTVDGRYLKGERNFSATHPSFRSFLRSLEPMNFHRLERRSPQYRRRYGYSRGYGRRYGGYRRGYYRRGYGVWRDWS